MPNFNDESGRRAKASLVRLPEALRVRLKASAQADRRSVASQIIVLLEQALLANEKAEAGATASAN